MHSLRMLFVRVASTLLLLLVGLQAAAAATVDDGQGSPLGVTRTDLAVPGGLVLGQDEDEDEDEDGGAEDEDEGAEDEDEGAEDEDEGEEPADEETYESELYGYTITYDPNEWQVLEDEDPDDNYDQIYFLNDSGVLLGLTGDPDYADDELADCVEDYVAGLESGESNSDVEPLDEADAEGDDDDRAWATYTYTYEFEDGDEAEYTRYYECRWLGDGVTLVILHDVPAEDYEDAVEDREEFLEGFEPAEGGDDEEEEEDEEDEDEDEEDEEEDEDTGGSDEEDEEEEDDTV